MDDAEPKEVAFSAMYLAHAGTRPEESLPSSIPRDSFVHHVRHTKRPLNIEPHLSVTARRSVQSSSTICVSSSNDLARFSAKPAPRQDVKCSLFFSLPEKARLVYFFLGPNMGAPMLVPVSLTFAAFWILLTKSMAGQSAPARSRAVMYFTSTEALAARSFCVMVVPFAFFMFARAVWSALATSSVTFFVATMSSDRSTLVRCWPSLPFCAACRMCQSLGSDVGF